MLLRPAFLLAWPLQMRIYGFGTSEEAAAAHDLMVAWRARHRAMLSLPANPALPANLQPALLASALPEVEACSSVEDARTAIRGAVARLQASGALRAAAAAAGKGSG